MAYGKLFQQVLVGCKRGHHYVGTCLDGRPGSETDVDVGVSRIDEIWLDAGG